MRNKILLVSFLLGLSVISGCNSNKIDYVSEDIASATDSDVQTDAANSSELTAFSFDNINITDEYKWQEVFSQNGMEYEVNAIVGNNFESEPKSIHYTKKYLSAEDKKKIIGCLLNTDTAQVDIETYPSKEVLDDEIAFYQNTKETAYKNVSHGSLSDAENAMFDKKIAQLTDALGDAPLRADVDTEIKDYTEDYYVGTINNISYSLIFNSSEFEFKAKDYSEVINSKKDVIGLYRLYVLDQDVENPNGNICNISKEEAENSALNICKEMGFDDVEVSESDDATFLFDGKENEVNGYYITLTQPGYGLMSGLPLTTVISNLAYNGTIYDVDSPVYPLMNITMVINDTGIVYMKAKGISVEDKCEPVTFLSYEQIKGCFKSEISNRRLSGEWSDLVFTYARIDTKDGGYCIIPVWRLSNYDENDMIVINAIDGSVVDIMDGQYQISLDSWYKTYNYNMLYVDDKIDYNYNIWYE